MSSSRVYGSPIPIVRQDLWRQLEDISNTVGDSKWMCIGDFNTYKVAEDEQGMQCQTLNQ